MHKQIIHSSKLSDIKPNKVEPCCLTTRMTVLEAQNLLVSKGILSAPVTEDGKIRDVVEQLDICWYTLSGLMMLDGQKHTNAQSRDSSKDTVEQLLASKSRTTHQVLPQTSTVSDVLRALVTSHRVVIVDESGSVGDVITQSDMAKFFQRHAEDLGSIASQPLQQVLITSSVRLSPVAQTVSQDTTAADAFKTLVQLGIQGIGVVDKDGKLVSQASASNLKLFSDSQQLVDQLSAPISGYGGTTTVLRVDMNTAFGDLLRQMVQSGTHRAFIVDEAGKPTEVLSLSDLMAIFCN